MKRNTALKLQNEIRQSPFYEKASIRELLPFIDQIRDLADEIDPDTKITTHYAALETTNIQMNTYLYGSRSRDAQKMFIEFRDDLVDTMNKYIVFEDSNDVWEKTD